MVTAFAGCGQQMSEKDRIAAAEEMKNREIRKVSDLQIFEYANELGKRVATNIAKLVAHQNSGDCESLLTKVDSITNSLKIKAKFIQLCSAKSRSQITPLELEAIEAYELSVQLGEVEGPILQEFEEQFFYFSPEDAGLKCEDCEIKTGPSGIWIFSFDQKAAIQNIK